jgi:hypothetical protein
MLGNGFDRNKKMYNFAKLILKYKHLKIEGELK